MLSLCHVIARGSSAPWYVAALQQVLRKIALYFYFAFFRRTLLRTVAPHFWISHFASHFASTSWRQNYSSSTDLNIDSRVCTSSRDSNCDGLAHLPRSRLRCRTPWLPSQQSPLHVDVARSPCLRPAKKTKDKDRKSATTIQQIVRQKPGIIVQLPPKTYPDIAVMFKYYPLL